MGVLGLCTQTPGSPDSGLGQWGPRYAIHAGRQLTGKGLRYLKTVRVTAAVHGSFTRLNPGFRYPHWAGVTGYTHPYGLAAGYVFVKQSGPPSHCDPSSLHKEGDGHPFSRSYGANLPSSLGRIIPERPWATHPGAPVLVLGTVVADPSLWDFHGHQGSGEPANAGPSRFHPVLTITALPGLIRLAGHARPVPLPRCVSHRACVAARTATAPEY